MAQPAGDSDPEDVARFRRTVVWLVIGLLVFTLVATLLFEGVA